MFKHLRECIFSYLLKSYLKKGEKGRLLILSKVDDNMKEEYNEQTGPGNVYNGFIEFILANEFIKRRVNEKDEKTLKMIKKGIIETYDEAIGYIDQ